MDAFARSLVSVLSVFTLYLYRCRSDRAFRTLQNDSGSDLDFIPETLTSRVLLDWRGKRSANEMLHRHRLREKVLITKFVAVENFSGDHLNVANLPKHFRDVPAY